MRWSLDIEFDQETGPGKGSWKGGTFGHGIEMYEGETHLSAMKRYCRQEQNHKGKKYQMKLIEEIYE